MWILGWLYMTCEDLEIWKDVWILGWRFEGKVAYQRYKGRGFCGITGSSTNFYVVRRKGG